MTYHKSGSVLLVFHEGKQFTIRDQDPGFKIVFDALKNNDERTVLSYLTRFSTAVNDVADQLKAADVEVTVNRDGVFLYGQKLNSFIARRVKSFYQRGLDFKGLVQFIKKASLNPRTFVLDELFDYLENNKLPVTDDGDFLAYKRVKEDYTDVYSGKVLNRVGTKLVFPHERRIERPNRGQECGAHAFHVCGYDYLNGYYSGGGYRTLMVQVDPQHVFSFPDGNRAGTKLQTLEYEIIAELERDDRIVEGASSKTTRLQTDPPRNDNANYLKGPRDLHELVKAFPEFEVINVMGLKSWRDVAKEIVPLFYLPAGSTPRSVEDMFTQAGRENPHVASLIKMIRSRTTHMLSGQLKKGVTLVSDRIVCVIPAIENGVVVPERFVFDARVAAGLNLKTIPQVKL